MSSFLFVTLFSLVALRETLCSLAISELDTKFLIEESEDANETSTNTFLIDGLDEIFIDTGGKVLYYALQHGNIDFKAVGPQNDAPVKPFKTPVNRPMKLYAEEGESVKNPLEYFDLSNSVKDQKEIYIEEYFTQKKDHNDPNSGTFQQRYFCYRGYYLQSSTHNPNRPQVFFEFGQEASAGKYYVNFRSCKVFAKKYNGICCALEHRQFGLSHVTSDASIPNLEYLTREQVLDDADEFRLFFNEKYKIPYPKWAMFGCSLAGGYVAEYSVRHPEGYAFGYAGAASVQYFYNNHYYMDTVCKVMRSSNPECERIVAGAFSTVSKMVAQVRRQTKAGQSFLAEKYSRTIQKYFQLCLPPNLLKPIDTDLMTFTTTGTLTFVVQYNKVIHNFLGYNIDDFCNDLMSQPSNPEDSLNDLKRFYGANCNMNGYFSGAEPGTCQNYCFDNDYDAQNRYYHSINWNDDANASGNRQWVFIICNYFFNYIATAGGHNCFGDLWTTLFYQQICNDYYDNRFNEVFARLKVSETNKILGGRSGIKESCPSCTIFTVNGQDPWNGVQLRNISDLTCGGRENYLFSYPDGCHCADDYQIFPNDPPLLKLVKEQTALTIDKWMTHGCRKEPVQCPH